MCEHCGPTTTHQGSDLGHYVDCPTRRADAPATIAAERALVEATRTAGESLATTPTEAREALAALGRAIVAAEAAGLTAALPFELDDARATFVNIRYAIFGPDNGPATWQC